MDEEIMAIKKNDTWELATLSEDKSTICIKWVYKLKKNSKALNQWKIQQMDVKSAFLNGVLEKEFYIARLKDMKIRLWSLST
ncbi:hypothetical protein A4A49_53905 [Nicotiana attenuata]|uniref:Reverse transcriptase Ty1/copia-type domain-containing protein n=2 Tax=Nicotiana attenuata TaxID=49451 RepID=A0A314L9M1_NICAT|nr:hypothetical protein A4A49_53905 [Nicotiana attenuata]